MYTIFISTGNIPWYLHFIWEVTMALKHELKHVPPKYASNYYVENSFVDVAQWVFGVTICITHSDTCHTHLLTCFGTFTWGWMGHHDIKTCIGPCSSRYARSNVYGKTIYGRSTIYFYELKMYHMCWHFGIGIVNISFYLHIRWGSPWHWNMSWSML